MKRSKYKADKCKYDFQQYEIIRSFGESIYCGKISICKADMDQTILLENIANFGDKLEQKQKKIRIRKISL